MDTASHESADMMRVTYRGAKVRDNESSMVAMRVRASSQKDVLPLWLQSRTLWDSMGRTEPYRAVQNYTNLLSAAHSLEYATVSPCRTIQGRTTIIQGCTGPYNAVQSRKEPYNAMQNRTVQH